MPYYAKPALEKSQPQHEPGGREIPMEPVGFAFNRYFIQELLREENLKKIEEHIDEALRLALEAGLAKEELLEMVTFALEERL